MNKLEEFESAILEINEARNVVRKLSQNLEDRIRPLVRARIEFIQIFFKRKLWDDKEAPKYWNIITPKCFQISGFYLNIKFTCTHIEFYGRDIRVSEEVNISENILYPHYKDVCQEIHSELLFCTEEECETILAERYFKI